MATGKIKVNFKMPTPSAADRMYAKHQAIRKAAGLPDVDNNPDRPDAGKYSSGSSKSVKRTTPIATPSVNEEDITIVKKGSNIRKKISSASYNVFKSHGFVKEEEQLDELSPATKSSYVTKAKEQIKQSEPFTKKGEEYRDIAKNFIAKRQRGIDKASKVEEGVTIGGMVGRGNIHQYDRNPGPKDGSELENVPFNAKTEKQKKLQNALNDLGKKMKEIHPKLKEMNEGIHQQIKKHLDAGHNVHSKAVGRIGQITQAHSGGVQLKVKGRTAVTRFDKGDKVKLLKKSDTEYHVVNEDTDPCWKGYKMVGMKNKNGRKVPNCVPGEGVPSMKKEGVEDDPKADQMTTDDQKFPKKSRKALIVRAAAKKMSAEDQFQSKPKFSLKEEKEESISFDELEDMRQAELESKSRKSQDVNAAEKKMPPEDQFQAKPVLDSQVAQQTNK
jgi:hypothetical protein